MNLQTYINRLQIIKQFAKDIGAEATYEEQCITLVCEPWYGNRATTDIVSATKAKADQLKVLGMLKYCSIEAACNCIYITME
jgi:hypothetical protein